MYTYTVEILDKLSGACLRELQVEAINRREARKVAAFYCSSAEEPGYATFRE